MTTTAPPPRSRKATRVLPLVALAVAACDPSGPDVHTLPGTLVLERPDFATWAWLPGGSEILYATPFDYPYDGPGTRFEAVAVPGAGTRTVVAAPTGGDRIIGYRWVVVGGHVYYEQSFAPDRVALHRAPLSGGVGERVLDSIPYGVSVSPDERWIGWVEVREVSEALERAAVLVDRVTGESRRYPVAEFVDRIHWAPDAGSIVVEPGGGWAADGTPFYWIDLETEDVRLWKAPGHVLGAEATRHFHWEGGAPFLYTSGDGDVARYSLATGERESLAPAGGLAGGWSEDFRTVVLSTTTCLEWSSGPFGGDCIWWRSRVDRLEWATGESTNIVDFEGPAPIFGHPSPGGAWLAFEYGSCGGGCYSDGDGVYVLPVP